MLPNFKFSQMQLKITEQDCANCFIEISIISKVVLN